MQPHGQRVIDEVAELKEKLVKLHEFFNSDTYQAMDPMDQQLMRDQSDAMISYHGILTLRIQRFNA